MKRIMLIAAARPNFMKIGPIHEALSREPDVFEPILIHTGQHYDHNMSQVFFEDLNMPRPDHHLGIGSGSHAKQTAGTMLAFEEVVDQTPPDMVLVVGDVNATLACSLVAAKLHIPVAHVEAGVRSYDRRMPEEINRVVTDAIADMLLTPAEDAAANLIKEGIPEEKIHFVGNVMIDALQRSLVRARESTILEDLDLTAGAYGLVTLHRPSNVDDPAMLTGLIDALETVSERLLLVFPVHPRTQQTLESFGLADRIQNNPRFRTVPPAGYLDFLRLQADARMILTDSGSIQGEATALGVSCLTLRDTTEWTATLTDGTNHLVGMDPQAIITTASQVLDGETKEGRIPKYWDGHAAERIADVLR